MADGVNERFDFAAELPAPEQIDTAHFIAIGGAGMSGIARLFVSRGIRVSGSDQQEVAVLQELRAAGAQVHVGYQARHISGLPPDAVVIVSSAIRADNPELQAAQARGLRVLHRSQGLAVLLSGQAALAVAGANGKTTTSAMATVALRAAGVDAAFAIGADIAGIGANAGPGADPVFVVEADESDGSFVVYHPKVAIVTNIKDDHLDFYGSSARLHAAYRTFAATIDPDGLLVACADDAGSAALAERVRADGRAVLTYGRSAAAEVRLSEESRAGFDQSARLSLPGGIEVGVDLQVPGAHNLLNAAGVVAALSQGLHVDAEAAAAGLSRFRGTSRRFEPRGTAGGVRVIDDYAHNPGKLDAVVQTGLGLRDGGRLVVLFQPHLYSRTQHAAAEMARALAPADHVVVLDIYGAREDPIPGVTGRLISDAVEGAVFAPDHEAAVQQVLQVAREGDLVLTVGAGDVTTVGPTLLARLAAAGR